MTRFPRLFRPFPWWALCALPALFVAGCANRPPPLPPVPPVVIELPPVRTPTPPSVATRPPSSGVMLGIDVLEEENFKTVAGKRIGLLTHAAGVDRNGVSTAVVLHRAPNVNLVELFAPEHGLDGKAKAGEDFSNTVDPRTNLPVFAFYGAALTKSEKLLGGLDALVIDLQDIGSKRVSIRAWRSSSSTGPIRSAGSRPTDRCSIPSGRAVWARFACPTSTG
jgi:hypothetical protein